MPSQIVSSVKGFNWTNVSIWSSRCCWVDHPTPPKTGVLLGAHPFKHSVNFASFSSQEVCVKKILVDNLKQTQMLLQCMQVYFMTFNISINICLRGSCPYKFCSSKEIVTNYWANIEPGPRLACWFLGLRQICLNMCLHYNNVKDPVYFTPQEPFKHTISVY